MNTSAIFAKLPNEIKGGIIHHLTDNSINYDCLINELEQVVDIYCDLFDTNILTPKMIVRFKILRKMRQMKKWN